MGSVSIDHVSVEIPTEIFERPYIIGVVSFKRVRGDRESAPWKATSDADYYGFTEAEYVLMNLDGTEAIELEAEIAESNHESLIRDDIEDQIADYFDGWEGQLH